MIRETIIINLIVKGKELYIIIYIIYRTNIVANCNCSLLILEYRRYDNAAWDDVNRLIK